MIRIGVWKRVKDFLLLQVFFFFTNQPLSIPLQIFSQSLQRYSQLNVNHRCVSLILGLAAEFRSEKIPLNRLRMVSVIPRKKMLIPRHSEVYGRVNSEARNRMEIQEKMCFVLQQNPAPENRIGSVFSSLRNGIPRICFFLVHRNGILSCFLFRGIVGMEFPSIYFCFTERNSEFFSLPRNGLEWNSENLLNPNCLWWVHIGIALKER